MKNQNNTVPFVIGHRGAAGLAPENTIASLRRAKIEGAAWVEFDVMLSADGTPILFHDDTVDRTTNGRGELAELSLKEIQSLDAGCWFSDEFQDERVPTFRDVISEINALGLGANVEIKPTPGLGVETAKATCALISNDWPGSLPSPVISSFDMSAMALAKDMLPDIERAMLFRKLPKNWESIVEDLDCKAVHMSTRYVTKANVDAINSHGFPVRVYMVNDVERGRELKEMGVSSIFTGRPDLF